MAQKGLEVAELDQADRRGCEAARGGACEVDLLRRAGGDEFGLHALVGRDAGEERFNDRAERRVALRPNQAAAVDEERRRGGDAERFGFGQVALDDGAVGVVVERALEHG